MMKKNWSEVQIKTVQNYYEFLLARAKGDLPSPATFVREFVQKHPSYKANSIVPSDVQCDLMRVLR
jgi:glutamate--cysteine ligase catalytic subunit